jgi:hypothetical protein
VDAQQASQVGRFFFPPPPQPTSVADAIALATSSSGVYFFYQQGICVYIGESIDIKNRLRNHEHLKQIDAVGVIYCDSKQRKRLECFYIGLLNPERNEQSTTNTHERDKTRRATNKHEPQCSLLRSFLNYVMKNPGSRYSDILRNKRTLNARRRREMLDFLVRWGAVQAVEEQTSGRPRLSIYPLASRISS